MAEAGASPAQEIAFTLADGIEYVRTAVAAGMDVDDFAPRLSFFFVARTTILEEVAKFRAARRIWARVMKEEFGAKNPKSWMLRFHTQTAGVQLTAQQPEVNLVRVAVQGLAAVLGGTQSLHTNSFDEAIALPTDKSARLALRTQQVLAYETDVTATVDPFAGSYVIEKMTDEVEAAALELMGKVEDLGGAVNAIERGFQKNEIERSAYRIAQETDSGERVVVGVNRFQLEEEEPYEPLRVDPAIEAQQAERLAKLRAERDQEAVDAALCGPEEGRGGHGQRAVPHEGRAEGPRHGRRGLQRPAGGVGHLRPDGRVLSRVPHGGAAPCGVADAGPALRPHGKCPGAAGAGAAWPHGCALGVAGAGAAWPHGCALGVAGAGGRAASGRCLPAGRARRPRRCGVPPAGHGGRRGGTGRAGIRAEPAPGTRHPGTRRRLRRSVPLGEC